MGTAEMKEAFVPFSNNGSNPSPALLIRLLWAIFAIPSNFRAQLAWEVLRGGSQPQLRWEKVPQESIPVLLGRFVEARSPAARSSWEIFCLASGVDGHMML